MLKGCTIEAINFVKDHFEELGFSCCWKDVRLKRCVEIGLPCNRIGFSCCWKDVRLKPAPGVCRRLWRFQLLLKGCTIEAGWFSPAGPLSPLFQLLLKGCTIEALNALLRIYDPIRFQLLLKGCTIEALKIIAHWLPIFAFQLLLKGCTIEAPKPTDWKQMIFDSWFLICFSKMVDLHKKCHYFRKFGVIWVIAWLFLIVVVTSSYILSTTKSP